MNPNLLAIVGIVVLVVLFMLRMPVAYAMGIVGFIGFAFATSPEAAFAILSKDFFATFSSGALTVLPMFVFMGVIMSYTGISNRLFNCAYKWLGQLAGGLAIATCYACAAFGACCGSTNAGAATMGKVTVPEMIKHDYDVSLATASVASAGSLAIMIPPSTVLIIYGVLTEESIGKLFIAGIIPGILLATIFAATVYVLCRRNPRLGPAGQKTTLKEKLASLLGITEVLILFVFVMGGILIGFFTPTEAGAAGAAGALIIGLARRQLKWKDLLNGFAETTKITAMIFLILTCATLFGHFMAVTRVPFTLSEWLGTLDMNPIIIMILIVFGYLVGGCFMDSFALVVLTVPVLYPVIQKLGFDPIWFGVMIVLVAEMGVITPPVGVNVYVIKGVFPEIPLEKIFKGIWPFLIGMWICALIIMFFPQIVTFLPKYMSY
ncbi:MAG: Sialic acid TRAP transporter permease protein SiaT [Syntrophorhabdus sp. PtaU1.Bin058]|nr:MAG: Sialic acid TRAP transporter permease protein SiaT [Syntrophorhabdus sp. PtaU1.Bin058]